MLHPSLDTFRLFAHLLAATIWVGGQITLAGLVPVLRRADPEVLAPAARRFAQLAWPAFAVLVVTGIWNVAEVNVTDTSTAYQVTLLVKLVVVAVSGLGAAAHTLSRSRVALAVGGACAGGGAIAALFLGTLLVRNA